jgi:hypothetical protein
MKNDRPQNIVQLLFAIDYLTEQSKIFFLHM